MILCHYLTQGNIITPLVGNSKGELLKTLVDDLARQGNLHDPKKLLDLILEREAGSSTFLPTGIAIPHARLPDISEIKIILGVIPEGFRETPDSEPTYLILLFFSPTSEKDFGKHLKLLSKISAIFRAPEILQDIITAKTPAEIFSLIQSKEREIIEK